MAVQAQHPSSIMLLPDFRKRLRPDSCNVADDFLTQDHLLPFEDGAGIINTLQQHTAVSCNVLDSEIFCNFPPAKRQLRENDAFYNRAPQQPLSFAACERDLDSANLVQLPIASAPQSAMYPCCSNDPRHLMAQLDQLQQSTIPSSTGKESPDASISSFLRSQIQLHSLKQKEDLDRIIRLHAEQVRQALEEKRQRHARALLYLMDQCMLYRMREKEIEIEKANRRNQELEERVKQLSLESQLWQNMARNSEAMVTSLRSNLEQVVAQSREQSKEGCGEIDVEDAESCVHAEGRGTDDVPSGLIGRDAMDSPQTGKCRFCRKSDACILLLPCRHLCLCKECDIRFPYCPLCRVLKTASMRVYMD